MGGKTVKGGKEWEGKGRDGEVGDASLLLESGREREGEAQRQREGEEYVREGGRYGGRGKTGMTVRVREGGR